MSLISRLVIATALALTFAPRVTAAPIVTLDVYFSYGDFYYTPLPGHIAASDNWFVSSNEGAQFTTPAGIFPITIGKIDVVSGPFISSNPDTPTHEDIEALYGAGTLSIAFTLALPGGGSHEGNFTGQLGTMLIDDGSENVQGAGGVIFTTLNFGDFDPVTAALFGIKPHVVTNSIDIFTDVFQGLDDERYDRVFGQIAFRAPEPSVIVLLAGGIAAAWRRRKARIVQ